MEEWQSKHITQNLPKLINVTEFNAAVKAELVAKNILSKADVDKLDALQTQHGHMETSYHFYQLLMGRTNAYKVLAKALHENHQTGAVRILIDGVSNNASDKQSTCLDISIKLDGFMDMEIEVSGKKLKLHEFLPKVNPEILQQIFRDTVSELEIYDTLITKRKTFVLASTTVPPKPSFYISRFLSNRIKVDESIFKEDSSDVFVFKKSIPRYQLSYIAKPHFTETSASQKTKITSRFIYLVENEDWSELKKNCTKVPIHLINYEVKSKIFLLEDSSAPSDIMRKLGSQNERVYMSEDDFVQQQLRDTSKTSNVCICDSPGMGKSYLLANIARLMTFKSTGRITVYVPLNTFVTDFVPPFPDKTFSTDKALLNILRYISPSTYIKELLLKMAKAKLVQLEIFFDGFDEIPSENLEWTKQIFLLIMTNFPSARIYITSRPHMRQQLEESVGVIAYDILPFNQQNQVDFLVQFWQNTELSSCQSSLQTYATSCLQAVTKSLTKNDQEIAGIPLLCQLIAEIYADRVAFHTIKESNFSNISCKISGMYQKFIGNKVNLVAKDQKEFDDIKLVLVWHALKVLVPAKRFHEDNHFNDVKDLLESPEILKTGIIHKHLNAPLEFIHRTFAEYLVAEYFATKFQERKNDRWFSWFEWFQKKEIETTENCSPIAILKLLLCQKTGVTYGSYYDYNFLHPVIVSFFNSALGEVIISEKLEIQGVIYLSSISLEAIILVMYTCFEHNLFNIFSFLKKSLIKQDNPKILECFTDENNYKLLTFCITRSTSLMFHACVQLLTEVGKLDWTQIHKFVKRKSLLQIAVKCANYEAVEYFLDMISLKNQCILENCVGDGDIETREHILKLLLNKDPTLINEAPHILVTGEINVRLLKLLVQCGADPTAVREHGENCAMHAATYMSPVDFHELIQFLLIDCKAECLFLDNEKWACPLPYIIEWARLLPETLELLLNISGIDINMKGWFGENLLFPAAKGNKVNNLQQLVNRGLDYNARGWENRSLLHVAASWGGLEMVRYLLSLKCDPNSRDESKLTPLHYASAANYFNRLAVVKALVENGANVKAKNNKGRSALHFFAAKKDYPNIELIKYIIRIGADVNDRDSDGNTPLKFCARAEVRDCLIEMGGNTHAKKERGVKPAQMKPKKSWERFYEFINRQGTSVNGKVHGKPNLMRIRE